MATDVFFSWAFFKGWPYGLAKVLLGPAAMRLPLYITLLAATPETAWRSAGRVACGRLLHPGINHADRLSFFTKRPQN
jgi:hypothetical protein